MAPAKEHDRFLMEAMWMYCNPLVRWLKALVADGAIGEVRTVQADFGLAGRRAGGAQSDTARRRTGCGIRHWAAGHCWASRRTSQGEQCCHVGALPPTPAAQLSQFGHRLPGSDVPSGFFHRSFGLSRSEPDQPHAPNGLERTGPRRTRPRGGDTHPVRDPDPGGQFPELPVHRGTRLGEGEALNHHSGGTGAPHADTVSGAWVAQRR